MGLHQGQPGNAAAPPADALKMACLPRLGRETPANGPAPRTLAERLNQMRIEDGRRERNREAMLAQQRPGSSTGGAPAAVPLYTTSASARAGTLYHQACQLAQQDMAARQQAGELRRKFAGPAPPTSWRSSEEQTVEGQDGATTLDIGPLERRRRTGSVRHFFDGSDQPAAVTSLVDSCLSCIASHLSAEKQACSVAIRESVSHLPVHIKERILAMAGRQQQCRPLKETALHWLLLADCAHSSRPGERRTAESWDSSDDRAHQQPSSLLHLDLSFAKIGSRMFKAVVSQAAEMHQLRALSIAGWGSEDARSLLAVPGLMDALRRLPHLETLSLASTRLCAPSAEGADRQGRMLESMTFLKRLSRSVVRLKVLDLSGCGWILGPDIANLGWFTMGKVAIRSKVIYPRLQHLALTHCPAFSEPGKEGETGAYKASPGYVGKWHAAHHGVAAVTDSPYLLDHRPGLGNAVLRLDDDSQRRERRRNAGQARHSVWGSADEDGSDGEGGSPLLPLHAPSSSGYPTRCPVSGVHVGAWEWERARLLDAVRGRWGSALKGNNTADDQARTGPFIDVYF